MFKKQALILFFSLLSLSQFAAACCSSNDEIKHQIKALATKLYQKTDNDNLALDTRLYQLSMPLLATSAVDKSLYNTIDTQMALDIDKIDILPKRAWLLGRMLLAANSAGNKARADVYRQKLKALLNNDLRWSNHMMTGWAWGYYYANTAFGPNEDIQSKIDMPYQQVLKNYQANPSAENLSNLLWTITMNLSAASEGYGHISLYTYYMGEYLYRTPYDSFDELTSAMPVSNYRAWLLSLNVIAALTHHKSETAAKFQLLLDTELSANDISDADRMLALANLLKIRVLDT